MPTKKHLHLYEEILLLAMKDREGTVASGTWYLQALGGALLAELLLEGHIALSGKNLVARAKKSGDALLDESLELIAASKRPRTHGHWLSKLSAQRDLKRRAAESLCRRGILAADRKRVLHFFEREVYPELDHAPEQAVVERLREAVFGKEAPVEPRTAALLSLAHHSGLLAVVFEKKELERRKARIERVTAGDAVGAVTLESVRAAQIAAIAALIAATI